MYLQDVTIAVRIVASVHRFEAHFFRNAPPETKAVVARVVESKVCDCTLIGLDVVERNVRAQRNLVDPLPWPQLQRPLVAAH